jgi:hypothetical protein
LETGLGQAASAFLHCLVEPITLNAPQVESMQVRQMNNVVDAVLDVSNANETNMVKSPTFF